VSILRFSVRDLMHWKGSLVLFVLLLSGLLALVGAITLMRVSASNPLAAIAADKLGDPNLRPGSELSVWIDQLGTPDALPQDASKNASFFYWADRGVSVFTDPYYHGQHTEKDPRKKTVTSIIIPLKRQLDISPWVKSKVSLEFKSVLDLLPKSSTDAAEVVEWLNQMFLFAPIEINDVLSFGNGCQFLALPCVRVGRRDEEPVYVEIIDPYFHYD